MDRLDAEAELRRLVTNNRAFGSDQAAWDGYQGQLREMAAPKD